MSEGQTQRELQGSRAALLKQWIKPTQSLIEHLRSPSLRGTGENQPAWAGEIRMIQDVERIRPTLKVQFFRKRKSFGYGKIKLGKTEPRDVVSSFGSLLSRRRPDKRCGI